MKGRGAIELNDTMTGNWEYEDWRELDMSAGQTVRMKDESADVFVCQKSCNIFSKTEELLVQFKNGFDGFTAFGEVYDYMPPIGTVDRLVLDFSLVKDTNTTELFSMLVELAANIRFAGMEIIIGGLNWNSLDKNSCLSV